MCKRTRGCAGTKNGSRSDSVDKPIPKIYGAWISERVGRAMGKGRSPRRRRAQFNDPRRDPVSDSFEYRLPFTKTLLPRRYGVSDRVLWRRFVRTRFPTMSCKFRFVIVGRMQVNIINEKDLFLIDYSLKNALDDGINVLSILKNLKIMWYYILVYMQLHKSYAITSFEMYVIYVSKWLLPFNPCVVSTIRY